MADAGSFPGGFQDTRELLSVFYEVELFLYCGHWVGLRRVDIVC